MTNGSMKQDDDEVRTHVVRRDFKSGERVMTPDGPGKVDGYGWTSAGSDPTGRSTRTDNVWVVLDEVVRGNLLHPYKADEVTWETIT